MEEVVGSIPTRSTKDSTSHRALLRQGGLSHNPQGLCVSAGAGCASSEDESLWLLDNYVQSCLDQLVPVPPTMILNDPRSTTRRISRSKEKNSLACGALSNVRL